MADTKITEGVNSCLTRLCREFYSTPTLFYTENDLTCRLHELLVNKVGQKLFADEAGYPQSLIHTEYPTPFLCTGSKRPFSVLDDGTKGARRGNYDLVVLNSTLVREYPYEYLKSQDYTPHGKALKKWADGNGPAIEYGIELGYKRDAMSHARATDKFGTADRRVKKIIRDSEKLQAAIDIGFMKEAKAVLFVRKCSASALEHIQRIVADHPLILVQDSIQCKRMAYPSEEDPRKSP